MRRKRIYLSGCRSNQPPLLSLAHVFWALKSNFARPHSSCKHCCEKQLPRSYTWWDRHSLKYSPFHFEHSCLPLCHSHTETGGMTRQALGKLHLGTSRLPRIPMQSLKIEGGLEPIPFSLLLSALSKAICILINPKASTTGKHWKLPSAWLALFFVAIISELCTCIFKQINQLISQILLDIFPNPFPLHRSCFFLFPSSQTSHQWETFLLCSSYQVWKSFHISLPHWPFISFQITDKKQHFLILLRTGNTFHFYYSVCHPY